MDEENLRILKQVLKNIDNCNHEAADMMDDEPDFYDALNDISIDLSDVADKVHALIKRAEGK